MEAHVKTVREILHSGDQFLVPFFQRQYSWTKKEWMNLYTDVVALFEGGDETKHFMGPLVCTPFNHVPAETPRYQLIDGQQRLTTLTIALAALRDVARLNGLADLADEIHEDYLVHKRRQDLERFKVVPRLEDRENYAQVLDGTAPGVVAGSGIVGCHSFFKRAWRQYSRQARFTAPDRPSRSTALLLRSKPNLSAHTPPAKCLCTVHFARARQADILEGFVAPSSKG